MRVPGLLLGGVCVGGAALIYALHRRQEKAKMPKHPGYWTRLQTHYPDFSKPSAVLTVPQSAKDNS